MKRDRERWSESDIATLEELSGLSDNLHFGELGT